MDSYGEIKYHFNRFKHSIYMEHSTG